MENYFPGDVKDFFNMPGQKVYYYACPVSFSVREKICAPGIEQLVDPV